MNNKQTAGVMASLLIALSQSLPVWGQAQQIGLYPANELRNVPGLIYDPPPEANSQTLNGIPGATAPGNIISPNPGESRAWPQDAPLTSVVKFRDLEDNPQFSGFTQFSLRSFNQNIGTDIGGVPLKDIELVNGLNLDQLKTIYNNGDIKIKDSLPAVQALIGVVFDPQGAQRQLRQNALNTGKRALINKLNEQESLKDVPFEDLLEGDWRGTITEGEQVLLREIGDDIPDHLHRLPIGSLTISVIEGDFSRVQQQAQDYAINEIFDLTLDEALERFPELQQVPVGSIAQIANQPLDQSLPQIADLAIENIPGLEDKLLSAVPGLGDSPVGAVLGDVITAFIAGDVFARFDIAHSGQDGPEEFLGRPLSGGTPNNRFKVIPGIKSTDSRSTDPQKGFPRWEMKPLEPGGLLEGEPILGREWMDRIQEVPGCNGIMCIFGRWQPAGIKPVRSAPVQISLGDTTEYPDKLSTSRIWADFQICVTVLFERHCTAHIFSFPTPWRIQNESLFPVLARRRIQDYFPGVDPSNRTVDICRPPTFLASNNQTSTAGSNPPSDSQYGHLAYEETTEQLFNVAAVDGAEVGLREDAAQAFEQLRTDAAAQGLDIRGVSGFRSTELQQQLWDNKLAQVGGDPQQAARTSAPPGYSEHATGYAIDVGNNANPFLNESWADTPEYEWLEANAGNYGFELSFPEGNSQGVDFEPWHWRYTGSPAAQQVFANVNSSTAAQQSGSAPNLTALNNVPGISNTAQQSGSAPTQNNPQHNIRQYLARIALGESNGGRNIGPRLDTGAFGEYQFIPETRQAILNRYGVDAWSTNKAERDRAALALIRDFSGQIGTDITALIEAGDFAAADRLLGRPVPGQTRFGQFTSLPGGAEAHEIWNNPEILAQYGPSGNAGKNAPLLASNSINCNPNSGFANIDNSGFQQGSGEALGTLQDPLAGQQYVVTSNYGPRIHPRTGRPSFHAGIDLAWDAGTPFRAADGGEVVASQWHGGYGNYILIDHGNGLATWYGHNQTNLVKVGDQVSPGQVIGTIGSTGVSTGPHIDFGVVENFSRDDIFNSGQAVDPRKYINFPPER